MPDAQRTIRIGRPVEEVFAFFSDPNNDQRWRRHVLEISTQGPTGVGSTIHQVVAGPGGRRIPADIEVTEFDSPRVYAFRVTAGPVRPVGRFVVAPTTGGSEVTFTLRAELAGLKKLLMSKAVQRSMDGEMASLDRAKSALETS